MAKKDEDPAQISGIRIDVLLENGQVDEKAKARPYEMGLEMITIHPGKVHQMSEDMFNELDRNKWYRLEAVR